MRKLQITNRKMMSKLVVVAAALGAQAIRMDDSGGERSLKK